jgi:hypothetical protein
MEDVLLVGSGNVLRLGRMVLGKLESNCLFDGQTSDYIFLLSIIIHPFALRFFLRIEFRGGRTRFCPASANSRPMTEHISP